MLLSFLLFKYLKRLIAGKALMTSQGAFCFLEINFVTFSDDAKKCKKDLQLFLFKYITCSLV